MSAIADETRDEETTSTSTKPKRVPPKAFTSERAREAGKRSQALRKERMALEALPPSDSAIEAGLRARAVTSAKDAEVLLRWLQRPRPEPTGMGLDAMSESELEGLYAGLLRLAAMEESQLEALLKAP